MFKKKENISGKILGPGKIEVFITIILTILLTASFPLAALAQGNVDSEVKQIIKDFYVDEPAPEVLQASTADEAVKALDDPYTEYLTAQEYQQFIGDLDPTFSGVGIYMDAEDAGARVVTVFTGSPAAAAGIKTGDIIIKAGEQNMAGLSEEELGNILQGPAGSTIKLTVQRGESRFSVYVTCREIAVPTVMGEVLQGHTGYINISTFGADTGEEFGDVLKNLRKQGADNWIIDLRDDPGGYVESACKVAGYFIGNKTAVNIEDRNEMFAIPAIKQSTAVKEPAIILINNNTASAAEILAAAIQDYDQAVLIGTTTYGKGTMQDFFELSNGDVLKMTVARFYSPLKYEINHVGVFPDVWMEGN